MISDLSELNVQEEMIKLIIFKIIVQLGLIFLNILHDLSLFSWITWYYFKLAHCMVYVDLLLQEP